MIRTSIVSSSLPGWIFFSVCCAMFLPSAAHAACAQWDISGEWVASQSNNPFVEFVLQQSGAAIKGSGHTERHLPLPIEPDSGPIEVPVDASVDGTINGDTVEFTAYWSDGTIGVYSGKVNPQGRIQGTTYDRLHPETKASWSSPPAWAFKCLSSEGDTSAENISSASATPHVDAEKPPVTLGRVHSSMPTPPPERMGNEPMICAQARSARARKSPVAPELEAKCQAAGGNFTDRAMTQAPSNIRVRNALALSRVGLTTPPDNAPSANPPADASPPDAPRMPGDRGMPGETFAPALFDDGAQLWACANAAQESKKAGACDGMKAGKAFCRAKGYSGALQQFPDGEPALTIEPARAGIPVRARNGDVCTADTCAVVGDLECAP